MTRGLFECIKAKINADLPDYRTIEIYRGQDTATENRTQQSILYPAVFVSFIPQEVFRLACDIKEYLLTVRFTFMFENYTNERLQVLDKLEVFRAAMDRFRGGEDDAEFFTSFEEELNDPDLDYDMLAQPVIDYVTRYRYVATYNARHKDDILISGGTVTTDIDTEKL